MNDIIRFQFAYIYRTDCLTKMINNFMESSFIASELRN